MMNPNKQKYHVDSKGNMLKRIDPFCIVKEVKGIKAHVCTFCNLEIPKRAISIFVNVKGISSSGYGSIRTGRFCNRDCFTRFFAPDALGGFKSAELAKHNSFFRAQLSKRKKKPRIALRCTVDYILVQGWRLLPTSKRTGEDK